MAHQPGKKVTLTIFIITLLLLGIHTLQLNPFAAQFNIAIEPTRCTWGVWQSFDMPELAAEWRKQLESAGLEATDISAYGVGEPLECTGRTSTGITHSESAPSVANTGVYATILVNSISDDAALGDIVVKILTALDPIRPYDYLDQASIHLILVADQSKSIEFYPGSANDWRKQGLTNAELFQALDGRYVPLTRPTATPLPLER